jgi:arginine decarboxylase
MKEWTIKDAIATYNMDKWGLGYFSINELGNVCVKPTADADYKVDLKKLVDELKARNIHAPILIRFMNILDDRIKRLSDCFHNAIRVNEYQGDYFPLYPIKVNQERDVVTSMLKYGDDYGLGLEAGSKAELMIVLAMTQKIESPIVCNGYKDLEFARLVAMGVKMGKKIIPVIENYGELESFIQVYKETGILPKLGVRIKLSMRGEGKWAKTGGDASKFGLRIPEVMRVVQRLKEENLLDNLRLLHFHIGSQITRIKVVKSAVIETMRVFVELSKLGAKMDYIDIGGGLGVDYDGSYETFSTINYGIDEYASDVVYRIKQVCDENHVPHPTIFSESGRFLTAHYSMLITDVPLVSKMEMPNELDLPAIPRGGYGPVQELSLLVENMTDRNIIECYHDAIQYRTEALNLFNLGYLSLPERAAMEDLFWSIMRMILTRAKATDTSSPELEELEQKLADIYFANFSLFQSLPDSWAIDQVFPITPIHRLNEEPDRKGIIVDLTCDSDGIIDSYVGEEGHTLSVPLHDVKPGEPYYIGFFLVGAYQETLGELHNLFGDPHAVQIELTGENRYTVRNLITGDTIYQVMGYVSYNRRELVKNMRDQIERAVSEDLLSLDESARMMSIYEEGLHGYTYFEE